MKKFIVNSHTYEGLAGETTDFTLTFDSIDEAFKRYSSQKIIAHGYQDSFVQLFEIDDNYTMTLMRAYYAEEYCTHNEYENNFFDGEYIRTVVRKVDGELEWVRYDKVND